MTLRRPAEDPLERDILPFFPERIRDAISEWLARNPHLKDTIIEVRLRKGLPVCIVHREGDVLLPGRNGQARRDGGYLTASSEDIERTLALVTDCSYYALENEFSGGYITIPGGHRVGLSGQMVSWGDGEIKLREVSGLNFRVAREVKGVAEDLVPRLLKTEDRTGFRRIASTLIISPPGCGKTTLLRDICRILGEGRPGLSLPPSQVGIVDERSEIAASFGGVPQLDVGPRADVLDRCPKARGMIMLLRSMAPRVIVTDEIGSEEDARAVALALCGGVSVIASCHGQDLEDVRARPHSSWLVSSGYFEMAVVLSRRKGPGTIEYLGEIW
ncbi:MAG TPA: stage III sporulation protein AA [Firmicutes bacterium]|uniref:Stage III sporulation protein AA n=1 Tax=Candidatus Fermentithermobacillus carboniphilus TaxID=3085328 RepID=A0AAT9LDH0_9FIRM|nr:MAG: stage III sporulation protein AA [Candidatus Fermentithermobacillus carboniphilus]HHW17913.1 stage III sporulation protein AA [Candidatus Fermentithermobacillaceae bacterium]